jgi:multicomponent Na+:H+ antiporter subunit B
MVPLILITGVNTVFHGQVTGGGGFQGGTIIAAALTLYAIAFGLSSDSKKMMQVRGQISVGLGIIGLCALSGIAHRVLLGSGYFMQNQGLYPPGIPGSIFSSGTIIIFGVGEGIHIAMGFMQVILIFAVMMELGYRKREKI